MGLNYTATQEKQLNWLRKMEPNETLGSSAEYHFTCKDDGDGQVCKAASTVIMHIGRHMGHRTWVQYVR